MREIIFRGLQTDGKWQFGDLLHNYIPNGEYKTIVSQDGGIYWPVLPESIGQFTGLLDKNGKKIFDGDVIETDGSMSFSNYDSNKGARREVFACKSGFVGVRLNCSFDKENESSAHIWSNYQLWNIRQSIEVIGNIHDDNPELLK